MCKITIHTLVVSVFMFVLFLFYNVLTSSSSPSSSLYSCSKINQNSKFNPQAHPFRTFSTSPGSDWWEAQLISSAPHPGENGNVTLFRDKDELQITDTPPYCFSVERWALFSQRQSQDIWSDIFLNFSSILHHPFLEERDETLFFFCSPATFTTMGWVEIIASFAVSHNASGVVPQIVRAVVPQLHICKHIMVTSCSAERLHRRTMQGIGMWKEWDISVWKSSCWESQR